MRKSFSLHAVEEGKEMIKKKTNKEYSLSLLFGRGIGKETPPRCRAASDMWLRGGGGCPQCVKTEKKKLRAYGEKEKKMGKEKNMS